MESFEGSYTCPTGNKIIKTGYCSACCPVTEEPTFAPTGPSWSPSERPSLIPSFTPSIIPTLNPSKIPSLLPSALPTPSPSSSNVANLLHRYSFNDGTADDSVSGLNGGLYSGAYIANGQAVFTASLNSYVLLPDILGTSASSSFSIETWATTGVNSGLTRIFHIAPQFSAGVFQLFYSFE
jgi:hypothetical protein